MGGKGQGKGREEGKRYREGRKGEGKEGRGGV